MRISQIDLEGIGAWPSFQAADLTAGLNLFYAGPKRGKSTLASFVSQLLYGTTTRNWNPPFGERGVLPNGDLLVDHRDSRIVLQRQIDRSGKPTITFKTVDGAGVDRSDLSASLGDMSPGQAAQLLAVDFLSAPQPEQLLLPPFLNHFGSKLERHSGESSKEEKLDRKRIEELVARRNSVARQLQEGIGAGRRDEEVLEQEARKLDVALNQRRATSEDLQAELSKLDAELAELSAYLRYAELEKQSVPNASQDALLLEKRLETLDQEISRCRQTISDLQSRWAILQSELVNVSPDGSADRITSLADSRFTLGVVEKLLDDLDAEVAQIARGEQTSRTVGQDAHARLTPIADLLRKQAYCLCNQISEQERAAQREQLQAEDRQLRRAQTELNDRLEQLLSQRESLLGAARATRRTSVHLLSPPATEQCRCTGHLQQATSIKEATRWGSENEANQLHSQLQRNRYELLNRLSALSKEIAELERQWKQLQEERAGLLEGTSVEATRAELDRLELLLKQALNVRVYEPSLRGAHNWHASDILAQLTDGELMQVRLVRETQELQVIDRAGKLLAISSLSDSQRDLLYLALTLSLVSDYASGGVHLPLLLDEPFLRQDATGTKIMAGVLEEFARAGHQVLVFTENPHAKRTLQTLGVRYFDLEAVPPVTAVRSKPAITTTTTTRLVRETLDGRQSPGLRIASGHGDGDIEAVFYLSKASSLSEFPVLGSQTATIFANLSIHTVSQLLEADAETIALRLDRPGIDATTVALWQSHMLLLCEVPELTLNDAQLLTACGIMSPHDLRHARTEDLWAAVSSFLKSDASGRYANSKKRYTRRRMGDWIYAAGGARLNSGKQRRTNSSTRNRERSGNRRRTNTSSGVRKNSGNRRRTSTSTRTEHARSSTKTAHTWKFHLELDSDVEAAPSIGPKTAERLAKIGIRTVADLLNAEPQASAELLDTRHIRANTITQWQDQSRLVCQIPELHGYGASLLVACGFTEPQQVAKVDAAELIALVQEYSETKAGQRILRSSEPPSATRIRRWVELAQHSRPLEVA